jgi:hypothetical protein
VLFHDLRHAYATLMIEAGEDLAVVSRSLSHADLSTTADVYAHLTPAILERAAGRMDRILGGRKAEAGWSVGYGPKTRGLRNDPEASFVLERVVGAERFERSTS